MTLDEAINEAKNGAFICSMAGSQKLSVTLQMSAEALEREQVRRPHDFDFEDCKLPGETQ